jgi:hypothetical protein
MKSTAPSVADYLASLPATRREQLERVRDVITRHLPPGYEERMNWGMISYEVPLSLYSSTYNKQPLAYAALAAQKNYNALYLMSAYSSPGVEKKLLDGFKKAGKKLDMGKSCIRFQSADDLPLETIGEVVGSVSAKQWIAIFEKSRPRSGKAK